MYVHFILCVYMYVCSILLNEGKEKWNFDIFHFWNRRVYLVVKFT